MRVRSRTSVGAVVVKIRSSLLSVDGNASSSRQSPSRSACSDGLPLVVLLVLAPVAVRSLSLVSVSQFHLEGRSVPHDVGVVGFDDWELFSTTSRPPLTTIDMNLEHMGRAVAGELAAAIAGVTRPGLHKLPVRLVPRESTAGLDGSLATREEATDGPLEKV